jgi:hypothetical protein
MVLLVSIGNLCAGMGDFLSLGGSKQGWLHQRSHFYTNIPLVPEVHFWLALYEKS